MVDFLRDSDHDTVHCGLIRLAWFELVASFPHVKKRILCGELISIVPHAALTFRLIAQPQDRDLVQEELDRPRALDSTALSLDPERSAPVWPLMVPHQASGD